MNKDDRSKELAFLLRHDKEGYKLGKIDENGWRNVIELKNDYGYSSEELEDIVNNDSKGRYEFSEDGLHIRARQGHSIDVEIDSIKEAIPPDTLFHGTSDKFLESILKKGLIPGTRLYVHLSADIETAKNVGIRHKGNTVILKINSAEMFKDGIKFRISSNGVWLVKNVDLKYIEIYDTNN